MYAGESICFGISTPEVDVLARFVRVRRSESAALNPTGDLTNAQFPMLNSHPKWDVGLPNVLPHTCGRFPFRMRIENWELNIGQILGMPYREPAALPHSQSGLNSAEAPPEITTRGIRNHNPTSRRESTTLVLASPRSLSW